MKLFFFVLSVSAGHKFHFVASKISLQSEINNSRWSFGTFREHFQGNK